MPHNNTILNTFHIRSIELRYEGKTYHDIAEILKRETTIPHREDKIRRWFARGGLLEISYLDYCKKENERRRALMLEELKKIVPKIPLKIEQLLDRISVHPFTGTKIIGEDGKPVPKLDTVTVATLKMIVEMLGFKIGEDASSHNPVDDYFDRTEQELAPKQESNAQ